MLRNNNPLKNVDLSYVEIETNSDFFWVIGLLEGEGYFGFTTSPAITLSMTDKDTVERARKILRSSKVVSDPKRSPRHKILYRTHLYSIKAINWMKAIKPFMSVRRKKQIDKIITRYQPTINRAIELRKKAKIIVSLYKTGKYTQQFLADRFKVSRMFIWEAIRDAS